jgi:uncharacterized protein (DUF1499 family)
VRQNVGTRAEPAESTGAFFAVRAARAQLLAAKIAGLLPASARSALSLFVDIEVAELRTHLSAVSAPGFFMSLLSLSTVAPVAALSLSGVALGLLALGPLGVRLEWWPYGFGLYRLMPISGFVAAAAIGLSVLTLSLAWSRLQLRSLVMLSVAVVLGAALVYVPAQYAFRRNHLPAIHDITTDTDNPPKFSAVLAARASEHASSVEDRRPQLAQLQKAAYPDVLPVLSAASVQGAFQEALRVAKAMPGWTIVAADAAAGRIEASEQSRWFRFTDDMVIRIVADEVGSRIDMRSTSRQGTSDYGVNGARIRAYMQALRKRLQ